MPDYVAGQIDGQKIRVEKGARLLDAARESGVEIPTLCHHEGLPEDGNCRLCLVETSEGGGPKKLVASCLYPLRHNGFDCITNSPKVREARAFVLQLLIDRAPHSPRLTKLAEEYGVASKPRFASEPDLCVRCGRCVRACEINGPSAISLTGRGAERKVAGPFYAPPEDCVGCLACAQVCPTGKIVAEEAGTLRKIWGREFRLLECAACGAPFAAKEQLDWLKLLPDNAPATCENCRKKGYGRTLNRVLIP